MKTSANTQTIGSAQGYLLITRERTEKLELLNHLVTNLAHTIIVCGPEGIGKTHLLKSFQETTMETWMFCCVNGDSQLSLEKIQKLIGDTISQSMPDVKFKTLEGVFDRMADWNMRVLLVVDDAGELLPGLIEKIISYADSNPFLRVIFALTHSELYLKNATDSAIEDCYQIEIPVLTEKQCGEFLEYLSTLHRPRVQYSAINENMVAGLYRETHGIPGKILAQLPKGDSLSKSDYSKMILGVAVLGLIALALGVQWWSSKRQVVADKVTAVQAKQPLSSTPLPEKTGSRTEQKRLDSINLVKSAKVRNDVIRGSIRDAMLEQDIVYNNEGLQDDSVSDTDKKSSPQPEVTDTPKIAEKVSNSTQGNVDTQAPIALDEGGQWLMAQSAENVTLQLMALPNEQVIIEVMRRHEALGQNLKYLKTKTKSGKDRFVLFYGVFTSPDQAIMSGKTLPKELQKFWVRKIDAIQREFSATTQPKTFEQ